MHYRRHRPRMRSRAIAAIWLAAVLPSGWTAAAGAQASPGEAPGRWSMVEAPDPGPDSFLQSVACISQSECWAVGYSLDGTTLIERWDGSSWVIVPSPEMPGSPRNILSSVACPAASDCWAVGYWVNPGQYHQPLLLRWDGTTWSITTPPATLVTQDYDLVSIACASPADCRAVGYTLPPFVSSFQTLSAHWDGRSWSIVPSANTSSTQHNLLAGVWCTAASSCWAVGMFLAGTGDAYRTLIQRWDGSSWSIVSSPNIASARSNRLYAVTCPSPSDCWVVGQYVLPGGFYQTLIERWDGTEWSIVPSPSPSATRTNRLSAVACSSPSSCWAVGLYGPTGSQRTLIEHWNGSSWEAVGSPNTSETEDNVLQGVTCPTPTECLAVGHHGTGRTLVLRYAEGPPEPATATRVDDLAASATDAILTVSGHATFRGEAPRVLVTDPAGDAPGAAPASAAAGLDLREGRVQRPDPSRAEMSFEWQVAGLPPSGSLPETIRYVWPIQVGTARYWIQAKLSNVVATTTQSDPAGHVAHAGAAFQLLAGCPSPTTVFGCAHRAWLEGEFDPETARVTVRVPLGTPAAPQLVPGAVIGPQPAQGGTPFVYAGYHATFSTAEMRDDAAWEASASYRIALPEVHLALAPAEADPSSIAFDTEAALAPDGAFTATFDLSGEPPGPFRLWARACFGANCGLRSLLVENA